MAYAGPGQGYTPQPLPPQQQQHYYPPPPQQWNQPGYYGPGQVAGPTYGQAQTGYQVAQPQPGYGNPNPQVVAQQPVQLPKAVELGRQPVTTVCPNCRATIVTKVSRHPGTTTFVYCCILSCVCCCCLPFCLDCAKDVDHKCPNCKYLLGTFKSPVTGDRGGGDGGTFKSGWDRPGPDYGGGPDEGE